jgi:hypothetical protein
MPSGIEVQHEVEVKIRAGAQWIPQLLSSAPPLSLPQLGLDCEIPIATPDELAPGVFQTP